MGEDTTRLGNETLVRTVLLAPIQAMGSGTLGKTLEIAPTPCPLPKSVIGAECIDRWATRYAAAGPCLKRKFGTRK